MKIYFLSGLGADKTVFHALDLSFCEPVFIDWIQPFKNESLSAYASRIKSKLIEDDAIIVGMSFGGMLATEIAKNHPGIYAVLISSAKTKFEIPLLYKTGKYIPFHQFIPAKMQRWFMFQMKSRLGIRTDFEKKVYTTLIKRNNKQFNSWAVSALINWQNEIIPANLYHIHGTSDKILPYKYVKCDHAIKGGEHMMVLGMAETISPLLKRIVFQRLKQQQPVPFS